VVLKKRVEEERLGGAGRKFVMLILKITWSILDF
jgi:hypothetical protein